MPITYNEDKIIEKIKKSLEKTSLEFISFDKFSELVDEALEEMRHLLETNKAIQTYIGVEPKIDKPETTESAVTE